MVSGKRREGAFFHFLRRGALIALLAGAAGSLGLMLHAGRHNNSRILLVLFHGLGALPVHGPRIGQRSF